MNPIDDLFREGLSGHAGEVPPDMWARVNAGKKPEAVVGEDIDKLFAGKLADRAGDVPDDMWARITAIGAAVVPEGVEVDQLFAETLKNAQGEIPEGMWQRIWQGVTSPVPSTHLYRRWVIASLAVLLLLSGVAWWQLKKDIGAVEELAAPTEIEVVASNETATDLPDARKTIAPADELMPEEEVILSVEKSSSGAAAGAIEGDEAKNEVPLSPKTTDEETTNESTREEPPTLKAAMATAAIPEHENESVGSLLPTANEQEIMAVTNQEREIVSTQALPSHAVALLPLENSPLEMKRHHRVKPLENGRFRSAPRHRFQTEFLFGIAYANQSFSVADEANRLLLSAREISEYPEASYQVTLRTNYRMGDRVLLTGGLTYSEIRNQLEYEQIVNGASTDVRINNSIRLLEAPLLLGYRLPGRRLHVSLNAGPVINLSTSARGRFLSPDAPQPLDFATEGNYRRNIGIGLMTSLSTTYRIGEKDPFLLVVEPFFKTYPGAFTVKDAPLREKYWVAGLQLGIRKEF